MIRHGVWTLKIQDIANQDGGSLNAWALKVCGTSACQLVINQISGNGPGSLPAALSCASDGDTIKLSASLAGQSIIIGGTLLQINKNVIILAQAANITITTTGSRIFEVPSITIAQLNGMTIKAGTSLTGGQ